MSDAKTATDGEVRLWHGGARSAASVARATAPDTPMVYVGHTRSKKNVERLQRLGWGRVILPTDPTPKLYDGEPWVFDNGAFTSWRRGETFDWKSFWSAMSRLMRECPTPAFGVVPDIVGRGERSLRMSLDVLPDLPREWRWYLAVQDRMVFEFVEPHIHKIDGIFLGGTNAFKATASSWSHAAHAYGKKFHYARAGTLTKVRYARIARADSLDSSFPLWTEDRWDRFVEFVTTKDPQMEMAW